MGKGRGTSPKNDRDSCCTTRGEKGKKRGGKGKINQKFREKLTGEGGGGIELMGGNQTETSRTHVKTQGGSTR